MARSMSALAIPDLHGNKWQYHSQSDRHSKIACWAILLDLLLNCPLLRGHIAAHKVGFGINHELRDFETRRKKNLDLVVSTPNHSTRPKVKRGKITKREVLNFVDLADEYEVILDAAERNELTRLPVFPIVAVGSVCVALEAKAAMTEHIKALPRLHDELDSSHLTVHGHSDHAIASALVTINMAREFTSPNRNKFLLATGTRVVTKHDQPNATMRTIDKVLELRRRSADGQSGFDAIGIVLVDLKNDGSPCRVVTDPPAPQAADATHYDQMIRRLAALYAAKFAAI